MTATDITTRIPAEVMESARAQVDALVQEAGEVSISSEEDYLRAADFTQRLRGEQKRLDDHRRSYTDPLNAEVKRINETFNPLIERLKKEAQATVDGEISAWLKNERDRLEREKAEVEAAASRAAEGGRQDDADAHMASLIEVPYKPTRAPGTSEQTRWSGTCDDLASLVLAVASGEAPLNLIQVNQPALNKLAQATKAKSTIPGVSFHSTRSLAASAR